MPVTGGGVCLWRDSILLYAAVRGKMRGCGPADALAALEGGIGLMNTIARSVHTLNVISDVLAALTCMCSCRWLNLVAFN
jgi:hypothetical protein